MTRSTIADDLREMMTAWSRIQVAVAEVLPNATDDERHKLCAAIMSREIGIETGRQQ